VRVCIADKNGVKMFQIVVRCQVVPVHIKMEIELHFFLTPALSAVEWTDSLPCRSKPGDFTVVSIEYEARETPRGLIEPGWTSGTDWTEVGLASEAA
jgi:hypothetical protein